MYKRQPPPSPTSSTKEQASSNPAVEDTKNKDNAPTKEEIIQSIPQFGQDTTAPDSNEKKSAAPTSISAAESYDMSYRHLRSQHDKNLIEAMEKEVIQRCLTECGGNQVKASAILGITRATLRKRIDNLGIRF